MATQTKAPKQPTGLKRLLITVVVISALLTALPYAMQYGMVKAITDAGSKDVSIDDIDFNVFTGKLAVKNLRAKTQQQPELLVTSAKIQLDWLPLFDKHILISSLSLTGVSLDIEQPNPETLIIGGITIPLKQGASDEPTSEKQPSAWGVGLNELHLVNNTISYTSPTFSDTFTINDFLIDHALSWEPDHVSHFAFSTLINSAPVDGELNVSLFADKPLVEGTISIKELYLNNYHHFVKDQLTELKGTAHANIEFSAWFSGKELDYKQTGTFTINNVVVATPELKNTLEIVQWDGHSHFHKSEDNQAFDLNGYLELDNVSSKNEKTQITIATLQKLIIENITFSKIEDVTISALILKNLAVAKAPKTPTLLETKQFLVKDIRIQNLKDIDINKVALNSLHVRASINKNDEISVLNRLVKSLPKSQPAANVTPKKEAPGQLRIGGISVSNGSTIKFSKTTEDGTLKRNIQIKTATLGEMNTQTPKKMTPINLKATIDKFSTLDVSGKAALFSKKTNLDINTTLKALEFDGLSPMVRKQLGYNIQQGQLNADTTVVIKENILDGMLNIDINGLELKAADQDKASSLNQQLPIPLDSALFLLRDSNDDIKLKLPVQGDIGSPDFELSDVLNTALINALKGGVTNLLKLALQPYGLIYMAAEGTYGAMNSIQLDALEFAEGMGTLPDDSTAYLERIGGLLDKSPNLRLRICGVSTHGDLLIPEAPKSSEKTTPVPLTNEQTAVLLALASMRSNAVKSHLISMYKIDATRLFSCAPEIDNSIDADKPAKPRIEIVI